MRFKRPPNEKDIQRRLRDFEAMKNKNQKFKNSNYFGKALTDICPNETLCPVFVEEVIKHVEGYGMVLYYDRTENLFKGNNKDNRARSMVIVLVILLMTLNKCFFFRSIIYVTGSWW